MARFLKLAACTAGGVLLLLLAGAAAITLAFDPNAYKSDIIALVKREHGRTLAIPGAIKLTLWPRVGADLGHITLSERDSESLFAAVDSARLSVALLPLLQRDLVIDRIDVRGIDATVVRYPDGSMNTGDLTSERAAGAGARTSSARVRLAIDSIRVGNARVLFDDRKAGRTFDISHLNIDSGPIARGVASRMALSANVRVSKPALHTALTITTKFLPDRERRHITFTDTAANLDFVFKEAKARLKGTIEVDLDHDEFNADLEGSLDDSTFDIKAGLRDKTYQFTLHIDQLDLGRYQPDGGGAGAGVPSQAEQPIDLTAISSLRANGAVHVNQLEIGGVKVSNVRAALRADGGKLMVQPMAAALYGGTSAGSLGLDFSHSASTPRITLVQHLKGVQAGPLLRALAGASPLEGSGDIALDINTEGASTAQMRRGLSGSASVRLHDGAFNGIDMANIVSGAQAPTGVAASGLITAFSSLSANFTVAQGIAHNADFVAHTALLAISGAGAIDLAREQLDYTLACTLVATGTALPLRLGGTWDAIAWRVEDREMSGAAVKQKAREKLKKAIRGLLKR